MKCGMMKWYSARQTYKALMSWLHKHTQLKQRKNIQNQMEELNLIHLAEESLHTPSVQISNNLFPAHQYLKPQGSLLRHYLYQKGHPQLHHQHILPLCQAIAAVKVEMCPQYQATAVWTLGEETLGYNSSQQRYACSHIQGRDKL